MANDPSDGNLGDLVAAEDKRTAARRRFLIQTTAGSGILILTFHHQRAMAGAKKIMTSSAATCASLQGTVKGTKQVRNVTNPTGPKVTATECQIPSK